MKFTVIILIITCLLGSLTPAISQDASLAKQSKPIWLKIGESKFLGENKDDYATINREPGNYIFWSTLGGDAKKSLQHGQSYKIQLDGMFLYCTAKGYAGLHESAGGPGAANDLASSWTIVKQKQQCKIDDDLIRHGDVIKLRNGYWKTTFLYDDGTDYAAAGDYPKKPQEWVVDWKLTKAQRATMPRNTEIIGHALYIDNTGGAASPGVKATISLTIEDQVSVSNINSKDWNAAVSVTTTVNQNSVPGTPSAQLSATASAAYGGEISEEIESSKKVTQGKSVEISYDRPKDCEVLLVTRISVPFQNFQLSFEGGVEPVKMRSINGSIEVSGLTSIYIPTYDNEGKIKLVPEAKVLEALNILKRTDSELAESLSNERLPLWKKQGWVEADPHALVLAPGSAMKIKQKYWSENKEFYAIFQPDGNFGVSTKNDGYKYDIYTAEKVPLNATKLILEPAGNLVFLDQRNNIIWSIDKLITPVANSTLNISNSGDILLRRPNGTVLWDSSKKSVVPQ